ncbi:MAG: DUF4870 domain-containing protein [Ignavibacteria bacterium]|jgi:hypothetical protein
MENSKEIITGEDKTLSLFCHLSMVIGGIILPIIIWAIKKEQSKFVRFHALQSIFYHLAYSVLLAIIIVVFALSIIFAGVGVRSIESMHSSSGMSAAIMIIVFAFTVIIVFALLGGIAYSIYIAVKAYQGEKTKIPIIGKIIYDKVYGGK